MSVDCSLGDVSSLRCCANYVKINGVCTECAVGYYGIGCELKCPDNFFGRLCKNECNCTEEYTCHFENGCISTVNQIINQHQNNESNESKHESSLGTLELIGLLLIVSIITAVIISSLLCFIKSFGKRKKAAADNVDALVNLLRTYLRSDHHCHTPCDTSQGDQGAVGGSALVPDVNEYATIKNFSHNHTLSSLSKWRRSRTPAIHNVLRKSISLTGMDGIKFVNEGKKSVFSNKAACTVKNTLRHSEVFFTKGIRSEENFATHCKKDFDPSVPLEDYPSPCEQDMLNRDKIESKYGFINNETGENWKITNNSNECSMEGSCIEDSHSDSGREYSILDDLCRDYHIYDKTRSHPLRNAAESVKEDPTRGCLIDQCEENEETSENYKVVVPEPSDVKGKRNRKLYQNDSTGAPSGYEFQNDNETSFISALPYAKRHNESSAMET